jgi:hypothetical protein
MTTIVWRPRFLVTSIERAKLIGVVVATSRKR